MGKIIKEFLGSTLKNPECLIHSVEVRKHNYILFKRYSIEWFISQSIARHYYKTLKEVDERLKPSIESGDIEECSKVNEEWNKKI